jgi:hypothetical protein
MQPEVLNLKTIVPLLCRLNSFLTIVDLCLRKVKILAVSTNQQAPKLSDECYNIIIDMFTALDQSIQEQKMN